MESWLKRLILIIVGFLALTEWNIWLCMGLWFVFSLMLVNEVERWIRKS